MRIAIRLVCVAAMTCIAGSVAAQLGPPAATPNDAQGRMQVFIAPCGRPYRAPQGEPYPVGKWFAEADANHDGRLTEVELRADALRFFTELDVNHDQLLEPDEVERYETEIAPEVRTSDWGIDGAEHHRSGGGRRHGGGGRRGMGGDGMGGYDGASADASPLLVTASYSGQSDEGGQSDGSEEHPFHAIGSFRGSMGGAARYSLIPRPEPVTAANINMRIDIRPSDFEAQASADFDALDNAHKGFLLLSDLPETLAQHKGSFGHNR
jgi:hypothetical protein